MFGKIPGDDWQKAATLRALYGFMYAHPGKKLMFMGCEFGQGREWNYDQSLDWHLLDEPLHGGLRRFVQDLNRTYTAEPPLHEVDFEGTGFSWIDCNDSENSVVAFMRRARDGSFVVAVVNFTPVPRDGYRIGVPGGGRLHGTAQQRQRGLRRRQRRQRRRRVHRADRVARAPALAAPDAAAARLPPAEAGQLARMPRRPETRMGVAALDGPHRAGRARALRRHQPGRALRADRSPLRGPVEPLLEAACGIRPRARADHLRARRSAAGVRLRHHEPDRAAEPRHRRAEARRVRRRLEGARAEDRQVPPEIVAHRRGDRVSRDSAAHRGEANEAWPQSARGSRPAPRCIGSRSRTSSTARACSCCRTRAAATRTSATPRCSPPSKPSPPSLRRRGQTGSDGGQTGVRPGSDRGRPVRNRRGSVENAKTCGNRGDRRARPTEV